MTTKAPTLRNHIRERRYAAGRTQADLAYEIGVDDSTLSKWESGAPVADRYKLALAAALGVTIGELFDWSHE